MARKLRFNLRDFERIRTEAKVLADLKARAERIEAACNGQSSWGGYESEAEMGRTRAVARVWSIGPEAVEDNARNQRLIRNLDAGR